MSIDISAITEGDLRRFAACWLNGDLSTNWDGAHAAYDPEGKSKLASFKTVTQKASKKASAGALTANSDATADKPIKKPAAGKRKKAASEEGEEAESEPKPKKGKGGVKRGKKATSEKNVVDDDEPAVKGEDEEAD